MKTLTKEQLAERNKKIKAAADRATKRKKDHEQTAFASNRAIGVERRGKTVVEEVVEK